jgi:AcrR family transcriptional regulator
MPPISVGLPSVTAERLLEVAEVLFAEHGFEGTSMRMITAAAGVNLAAVNYHFGSKEELFQRVFHRRLEQLNRERRVALDLLEAQAQGEPLSPRQILEAFFGPALAMVSDRVYGGETFMRLLGRSYTAPAQFVSQFMAAEYAQTLQRYLQAAYRAMPEIPREEIAWRLHFMTGAATYAISGVDALALITGEPTHDPDLLQARLIAFFLEGLPGTSSFRGSSNKR